MTVADGGAPSRVLVTLGTDALGKFGLDERLVEHLGAAAQHVDVAAGLDGVEQAVQVKMVLGHWVLLQCVLKLHTEDCPMAHLIADLQKITPLDGT